MAVSAGERKGCPESARAGGAPPGLGRSPLGRRRTLPLLEGAKKGVGVLVAEQVGGLVELQGRVQEVVVGQLAPRLSDELLEGDLLAGQAALERTRAHP